MSVSIFYTPLRYPGGKSRLTKYIKAIFEQNALLDGHYVEPYAGGAAVGLGLLFHEYVSCIHINDLNRSIYSFWYSVLNETQRLCRLISTTPVTMRNWKRQKYIQTHPDEFDILSVGFSTFFLNRTNRSGIISGGVIGGKDQTGAWGLDARFNQKELVSRVEQIADYRHRIHLYNLDAADLITKVLPLLPSKSLVYLDPPYYVKGVGLYDSYYEHEDHVELARIIPRYMTHQKWIVSYDNVSEVRRLYRAYRHRTYSLAYSAGERYRSTEIMFFCDSLKIPSVQNPVSRKIA
jgi:DNA adenine methylase